MKKITTFLIAIALVAISANGAVTVNVRTTTGDAPFLYVWDGGGAALNGAWPGTIMDVSQTTTTDDNLVWFTQTFNEDAINIIFNDGMDPIIQTADIMGVTNTRYYIFDIEEGEYEDVSGTYVEDYGFDPNTLPAGVKYVDGKEFAYFVAPASWTKCNVWAWSNTTGTNFTNSKVWPGDAITLVGNTTDGAPVYQWIGPDIVENDRPEGIIFNNGSTQTGDMEYVAGGVYDLSGKLLYTVEPSDVVPGDVNGDGKVTSVDITALYNWLLDNDDSAIVNGDQDGDNKITSVDITIIYNILLGE